MNNKSKHFACARLVTATGAPDAGICIVLTLETETHPDIRAVMQTSEANRIEDSSYRQYTHSGWMPACYRHPRPPDEIRTVLELGDGRDLCKDPDAKPNPPLQRGIRDETGGRQRPWVQYDVLPRDFVFVSK
jgi:hypothetical protein